MVPQIDENFFIISDNHFGHKGAPDFEPSRAEAVEDGEFDDQDEMMINRWNAAVGNDDTTIIVGDFAFKNIMGYTDRLNGKKILIRGNHDRPKKHAYIQAGFDYVYDSVVVYDEIKWVMDTDDTYLSGVAANIMGYGNIFISHYPVGYVENEYEKTRRVSLKDRMATMTQIARSLGCQISIHGHTHSEMLDDADGIKYLNVSAEALDFQPIRIRELLDASGFDHA